VRALNRGWWLLLVPLAAGAAEEPPAAPPFVDVASVSATSFVANKKDPQRYSARQALLSVQDGPRGEDEGPATYSNMWCEGRPDEGIGETLTVTLTTPQRVDSLDIAAGVWKSERLFTRNNLPTRLEVSIDGGAPQSVAVPHERERVSIALGKPVRSIAIKIAAVKKGAINDSCLSSVTLVRDGKRMAPLFDLPAGAARALPNAVRRIVAAVASEDLDAVAAVADFPLTLESAGDQCTTSAGPTFPDHPVTHKTAKDMRRDCLAYRKQEPPTRANPCPTGHEEAVSLSGGGESVDVHMHSMCSYTIAPVYSLLWRAGAWKLSQISVESLP
jgi:hypothetical protein